MATQSSILAWETPWTGRLQSIGLQEVTKQQQQMPLINKYFHHSLLAHQKPDRLNITLKP